VSPAMNMADLREDESSSPEDASTERRFDNQERAFEQALTATNTQKVASLNAWLGTNSTKKQVNLQSVDVELAKATVKLRARDLDVRLKRLLAWFAVIAVGAQLLVANFIFARWSVVGAPPPSDTVLIAWLSSTVVEIIGIIAIVARNLFPDKAARKGKSDSGK